MPDQQGYMHTLRMSITAFPQPKCLRERDSVLRYTYIVFLVIIAMSSIKFFLHFWSFCLFQWRVLTLSVSSSSSSSSYSSSSSPPPPPPPPRPFCVL
jgi:hypothetical protein